MVRTWARLPPVTSGSTVLPHEAVLREQVEEGLEQAGVRGLVDRGRDDHAVGLGDGFERPADLGLAAAGGEQVGGGEVAHGEQRGVEAGVGQAAQHVVGDDGGTGVGGGAAGDGEQAGHGGSLGVVRERGDRAGRGRG